MKTVRMETARMNFSEIVNRARYMRERFVIEKHGKPMALVIPIGEGTPEPEKLPDYLLENLTEFVESTDRP